MPEENALNYAAEQSDSFISLSPACQLFWRPSVAQTQDVLQLERAARPQCTYCNRIAIGWKSFTAKQKYEESDNLKSYCQRQSGKTGSEKIPAEI